MKDFDLYEFLGGALAIILSVAPFVLLFFSIKWALFASLVFVIVALVCASYNTYDDDDDDDDDDDTDEHRSLAGCSPVAETLNMINA